MYEGSEENIKCSGTIYIFQRNGVIGTGKFYKSWEVGGLEYRKSLSPLTLHIPTIWLLLLFSSPCKIKGGKYRIPILLTHTTYSNF